MSSPGDKIDLELSFKLKGCFNYCADCGRERHIMLWPGTGLPVFHICDPCISIHFGWTDFGEAYYLRPSDWRTITDEYMLKRARIHLMARRHPELAYLGLTEI
jgi:hypothetical protein